MFALVRSVLVRTIIVGVFVWAIAIGTIRGHLFTGKENVKFRWGFGHFSCSKEVILRGLPGEIKLNGKTLEADGTKATRADLVGPRRRERFWAWTVYDLSNRKQGAVLEQNGELWVYRGGLCD